MKNLEYKASPLIIEDTDDNQQIIKGYGSIFNNVDAYGEVVAPGAFTKTLKENFNNPNGGIKPKFLYQHNPFNPIGKFNVLKEDTKGLYFEAEIAQTTQGKDIYTLIKSGVLDSNSIGYYTITSTLEKRGVETVRILKEVMLKEISVVTYPANPLAKITDIKSSEGLLSGLSILEAQISSLNISDEFGNKIVEQFKSIKDAIINYEPENMSTRQEIDSAEIEKIIHKSLNLN